MRNPTRPVGADERPAGTPEVSENFVECICLSSRLGSNELYMGHKSKMCSYCLLPGANAHEPYTVKRSDLFLCFSIYIYTDIYIHIYIYIYIYIGEGGVA